MRASIVREIREHVISIKVNSGDDSAIDGRGSDALTKRINMLEDSR